MINHCIACIAVLCAVVCPYASTQEERPRGPVIRQVDHILIESGNPGALFDFFTDTLQLPTAWPLTDNQGYISGGVGAGNVDIVIYRYTDAKAGGESRFAGLAFEPVTIDRALYELRVRGIDHPPPEPSVAGLPDGTTGVVSTRIGLPSFSRTGMSLFLYAYSPEFLRIDVRRRQHANRITLRGGGPLGFRSVKEIVIAVKSPEDGFPAWDALLGKRDQSGKWRMMSGPSISLVRGTKELVQEIIIQVDSLEQAKAWLQRNQMPGTVAKESITLNPSLIQELSIRLSE